MPIISRVGLQRWVSSFQRGGYMTNASKGGWRPRAGGRDPGRPILVDTFRLYRSVKTKRINAKRVVWGTNVPYGGYHNDGTSKLPQREFMGDSDELFKDIENILDKTIIRLL
jgi:phage gpG-like protein